MYRLSWQNRDVRNERLREAMDRAGVSTDRLAEAVGVDPKSVWRWTSQGVVPRRIGYKARIADILGVDESDIWPTPPSAARVGEDREVTEEVATAWAHRADAPKARWWAILSSADASIDLLGYAMQFLPEDHSRLDRLLIDKAAAGCRIRIALADPESKYVAERDEEEGLGGTFPDRIRSTLDHYRPLFGVEGIDLRFHETRMYNSIFRGDDEMFVTPHLYALKGYRAPLLHLRRLADDGMFDGFAAHFERVWTTSTPIPAP
ncbi:MAG: helix-turn-helix domain-containing protein [Acidimicrobiia bacterium]|nr:helix-turn-helix domain-containing protein [Acidimicrobiia bacterium]MBT8194272.1 helix-turn-helix domain-containing protein [Acidimicrobiia bacterium]NNL12210.1 helix-turn-helix transcriptional regulator [Acidimicrobiia bacterium]